MTPMSKTATGNQGAYPPTVPLPSLRLTRLPGELGPILRCYGELTVTTAEALRRELALLESLGHPALTLSLAGCDFMDVEGILTILDSFKRLRDRGQRLVVAAGTGQPASLLRATRIDGVVPVFPREDAAVQALRGGGPPPPGPASWAEARAEAVARWRVIQHAIEQAPPQEILHHLTSMTALCERSETVSREFPAPLALRCQFCPLFYALGGRSEDVGCRSILEPLIQAIQVSNHESARMQVENVIHTMEAMPLPEDSSPPDT